MAAKRTLKTRNTGAAKAKLRKVLGSMESEDIEEPMDEEHEEKMTDAEKLLKKAENIVDGDIDDEGYIEIKYDGKWRTARVCAIEYDGIDPVYRLSVMDEDGNLPNKITMVEKEKNLEIRATNSVLSEFGVQRKKNPKSWAKIERNKANDGSSFKVMRSMLNVFLFTPFAITCTLTNIYKHIYIQKKKVRHIRCPRHHLKP